MNLPFDPLLLVHRDAARGGAGHRARPAETVVRQAGLCGLRRAGADRAARCGSNYGAAAEHDGYAFLTQLFDTGLTGLGISAQARA